MGPPRTIVFISISTFINFHYCLAHLPFPIHIQLSSKRICACTYVHTEYTVAVQTTTIKIIYINFCSGHPQLFDFPIYIIYFHIYNLHFHIFNLHSFNNHLFPKITKCHIDPTNDESSILQRSNHQRIHWLTIIHVHLARVHSGNQLIHDHSLLHHVQIFHLKLALPPLTRFQLSLMLHSIHFQIRLDLYMVVLCICYCLWEAWALAGCIGRLAAVVSLGLPQHITSLRWVTTSKETEHDAWLALIVAISNDCQGHWRAIHYAPARLQTHMSWLCTDVTCHLAEKWVVYDITHQILVKTVRLLAVKSTHNNQVANETIEKKKKKSERPVYNYQRFHRYFRTCLSAQDGRHIGLIPKAHLTQREL